MDRPIADILLFASIFFLLHGIRELFKPYRSLSRGIHEAAQAVEQWRGMSVVNGMTALAGLISLGYIAGSFVVGAISRPLMYAAASLKMCELFDEYLCLAGYRRYGKVDFYHGRIQTLVGIALAAWVTIRIFEHLRSPF